jgi:chromosome condensin MukBEF complex kleisin-like MukF subunit
MFASIKKITVVLSVVMMLMALAGCQQVSDARAEFCQTLRDVGTQAAEFKAAKIDQPADQVRSKVADLQQKQKNLQRLAKLTNNPALDKLNSAIDNVSQVVGEVKGSTLGPIAEKISAAGDKLQQSYTELNDAVCVAK